MNHLEVIVNNHPLTTNFDVALKGDLNNMNAINFKKDLLRMVQNEYQNCTVNITQLNSIDLTGLNALVMAHRSLESKGKELTIVCNQKDQIDQFLKLTKFDLHLNLMRA